MLEFNKIYNADCLEIMDAIDSNSVDMVFCDLPYQVTALRWDKHISLDKLWHNYNRICKPTSAIVLMSTQPFTTDLIMSNKKMFRYCWYWIKNQGTNFFHASRMPIRKVEEILIFYNKQPIYNPQKTKNHVPTNSTIGTSNGKVYFGTNKRNYKGGSTERYPINVLNFKCVNNYSRIHPTEKPVELIEYMIRTYTNEGNLVLDNCSGSGSTGVACINTKRNYILIEKNKQYYEMSKNRIANVRV